MQSPKQQNELNSFPRKTIQHHTNLNLFPNHWYQISWSWIVLWRPTGPSRTNTKKKKCPLHHRVCHSITKSYSTLHNPMDHSTPGFPVLPHLPEFAQTHVHWVSDAMQPSHSLPLLLLLPSVFPRIRVFSSESSLCLNWNVIPIKEPRFPGSPRSGQPPFYFLFLWVWFL